MSYDFDGVADRSAPVLTGPPYRPYPRDLEHLVTLLQLAAVDLSPSTGSTFSRDELFTKAHEWAGGESDPPDVDLVIVLPGCRFLQRLTGGRYRLR